MAAAAAAGNQVIPCNINSWDEFWTSLDRYVVLATDETSKIVFVEEERANVFGWLNKQKDDMKAKIQNGVDEEIKEVSDIIQKFDTKLS